MGTEQSERRQGRFLSDSYEIVLCSRNVSALLESVEFADVARLPGLHLFFAIRFLKPVRFQRGSV